LQVSCEPGVFLEITNMDTEASSTIETATVSQAGVPSCADQRRTGIAFSCLLGAFCGLYLDYVLKNGASMGPTPAIFYWLLFIIASGFFIERNAFKGGWFSKESLWLLLPPLVVIVTFVAPPLLSGPRSGAAAKGRNPNTDKIGSSGPRNHTPIF